VKGSDAADFEPVLRDFLDDDASIEKFRRGHASVSPGGHRFHLGT
jgi:hypothetical protein